MSNDSVSLRALLKYDHRDSGMGIGYRVESGGSIPLPDAKTILGYAEFPKNTHIPGRFNDFTDFRHIIEEKAIHYHWKPGMAVRETFVKEEGQVVEQ